MSHELTDTQKRNRVRAAQVLLARQAQAPFLHLLVTGDEKWVSFRNPNPHNEWLEPGQRPSATPRKDFRNNKAMLCVFWSIYGVIHWELLEHGTRVNSELYCQQLDRVNRELRSYYQGPVVFLDDNVTPHTARLTKAKLAQLGWDRLDHPPYSPDLAPSDFHLFRSLQHYLKGTLFANINEARQALNSFFSSKEPEFYERGINKLPQKWQEVIDVDGEYYD